MTGGRPWLLAALAGTWVAACGDSGRSTIGTSTGPAPSASSSASAVPSLDVPHVGAAGAGINLDGALDEPVWDRAADTGAFVEAAQGGPTTRGSVHGRARLLYDDASLYVGIEVSDMTLTGGFPPGSVDPHLWERDTAEIMVDPDGDGDNLDYYEIQIGPQNLVFDSRFDGYNTPRGGPAGPFGHEEWSAGLTSAVRLDGTLDDDANRDGGYVVEAKIPWSAFEKARIAPPRPGDEWRMNFYAMENNGGAAWSPILGQGNFHKATRFGRIRFAGGP